MYPYYHAKMSINILTSSSKYQTIMVLPAIRLPAIGYSGTSIQTYRGSANYLRGYQPTIGSIEREDANHFFCSARMWIQSDHWFFYD
jgi:hypothetical protein